MPILLLLFIIVPIAEMWLLIQVGARIGAFPTIGLVLLTAMAGMALLRWQGISTLTRANRRMQTGELPAEEMVTGLFLAIGGALLLTPGFITDAIGFVCLIPGLRNLLLGQLLKRWQMVQVQRFTASGGNPFEPGPGRDKTRDHSTIEGEYKRED